MPSTTAPAESTHPGDMAAVMVALRTDFQAALDEFLAGQYQRFERIGPECHDMADAVRDLLRGGKRLRALFCYWGWRAMGGAHGAAIVRASAALELFQAAALIHDDLMDNSYTRRGQPAVHRRFTEFHQDRAWHGDSEEFGAAGAILSGDLSLVWCDELFASSGFDAEQLRRGRIAFDRMRSDLMFGQYLDMYEQARGDSSPEAMSGATRVLKYKSAKYTIEEPLQIGAQLAGAAEEQLQYLSQYGLSLGQAFQLRDDLLGVFGDPEVTGKPAGDDLMEGKRTVLIIEGFSRLDQNHVKDLEDALGDRELSPERVQRLRDALTDCGAVAAVEERIEALVHEAHSGLDAAEVNAEGRAALLWLAQAATRRAY